MKSKLLFPHHFKKIGWIVLIPTTIFGIIISITGFELPWLNTNVFAIVNDESIGKLEFFKVSRINITNTITGLLLISGGILVGFSKEKIEDEYITNLRLSSLVWAVYVNYALLFLCFLFIFGFLFLTIMIYNIFTVLIIFIIRFNYILYKNSKIPYGEK